MRSERDFQDKIQARIDSSDYTEESFNVENIIGIDPPSKDKYYGKVLIIGRGNGKSHRIINEIVEAFKIDPSSLDKLEVAVEQKQALAQLGQAVKGFSDVMIQTMRKQTFALADLSDALITSLQQPEPEYIQKHKPWKKDRFYY